MKRGLRRVIFTAILVVIAGTVTFSLRVQYPQSLSLNPLLTPTAEYLEQNPQPLQALFRVRMISEQLCVTVNQGELLVPNYASDDLDTHIRSNLEVVIDNHPVERIYMFFSTGGPLNGRFDTDGNLIGTYGFITACIARRLEAGLHLATVRLPDITGTLHSYTWAFRVEPTPDS